MQNQKENIVKARKNLHLLRDIENDKLYHLANETYQEVEHLNKETLPVAIINNSFINKFNFIYPRIISFIKKENNFILPYIDKVLDKADTKDQSLLTAYTNLTIPLKMHIVEQSKIMDKLIELKSICFSSPNNSSCGKVLLAVIEISQLFEKHIFIEQRILIPALVQLVETKPYQNNKIDFQAYVRI